MKLIFEQQAHDGFNGSDFHYLVVERCLTTQARKESAPMKRHEAKNQGIWKWGKMSKYCFVSFASFGSTSLLTETAFWQLMQGR